MARFHNFKTQLKRLIPLFFLLVLLATPSDASDNEGDNQPRRQHRRRRNKAQPTSSPSSPSSAAAVAAVDDGAHCPEPTEKDVRDAAGCPYELHESFYQYPGLRNACNDHTWKTFVDERRGPVEIKRAPLDKSQRSQECKPQERPISHGYAIKDPCPITWVLNVDKNRVPRILVEGQCLNCTECMSSMMTLSAPAGRHSSKRSNGQHRAEEASAPPDMTQCQEVYYYTRVLRRTTGCHWHSVWERITVGCACRAGPFKAEPNGNGGSKTVKPRQH